MQEAEEIGSQIIAQFQTLSRSFSGPLPHPEILKGYNDIDPGLVERVFQMAEADGRHERKMEWEGLKRANREVHVGQILGFVLGAFVVACGTYAAVQGHTVSGSIIGSGGVVGIVAAFIYGSRQSNKEPEE